MDGPVARLEGLHRLFAEESWLQSPACAGAAGKTADDVHKTIALVKSIKEYPASFASFLDLADTQLGAIKVGKDNACESTGSW
jgi:hypothetical protein